MQASRRLSAFTHELDLIFSRYWTDGFAITNQRFLAAQRAFLKRVKTFPAEIVAARGDVAKRRISIAIKAKQPIDTIQKMFVEFERLGDHDFRTKLNLQLQFAIYCCESGSRRLGLRILKEVEAELKSLRGACDEILEVVAHELRQ